MGRDGARTPMPWSQHEVCAGFTTGKAWLPVADEHLPVATGEQEKDEDSVLNFFRRLIGLRKDYPVLRHGSQALVDAPEEILAFTRSNGDNVTWCVFNLGKEPVDWQPDAGIDLEVLASVATDGKSSRLPPGSGYIGVR
jgi:alpha-glucosidase